MTSQEFKQHLNRAQKAAQTKPFVSMLDALMPRDDEDVELELPPRSRAQRRLDMASGVPSEVADLALNNDWSALRAWREFLGMTQEEVAIRVGISQAAYSQHEHSSTLRKSTRAKLAKALGIHAEQLDF